jgi:hypothetical protein
MKSETRQCQNCKKDFVIEPEDFNFYEKIKVPLPTFCPECRTIRRLCWRNEHNLFRKKDLNGNDVFSAYDEGSPIKIYDHDFWYSDKWDPMNYGKDYDFSKPFFIQFRELLYSVPVPSRVNSRAINSDYSNNAGDLKNCYLCFNCNTGENCSYGIHFNKMRNSINFSTCSTSEECCNVFNITDCYRTFMSTNVADCIDIYYCFDCRNCQNCIGCVGLRHKNYCIFNQQYTREEFFQKVKEIKLGSRASGKSILEKLEVLKLKHPRKYMHTMKSVDISGDYVFGSKSVQNSFTAYHGYDVKYSQDISNTKDAYDVTVAFLAEGKLYENVTCGFQSSEIKFCFECHPSCLDTEYCVFCSNSSYLFGCVGLRNKKYCIFNKQYTKEEYEILVLKIKKQMYDMPYIDHSKNVYRYGEFFPSELSPFAYNDTIAQEYFPLTQNDVGEKYRWRKFEKKGYTPTILHEDIPDDIADIADNSIDQTFECEDKELCNHNCSKAFKVISSELSFYKKHNIPFPRKCPNCRHYNRIEQRNPLKLWHRQCMCDKPNHQHADKCNVEFETSYSPERPEIIYCEKCYQQEVY